jgi:hypothetical protein
VAKLDPASRLASVIVALEDARWSLWSLRAAVKSMKGAHIWDGSSMASRSAPFEAAVAFNLFRWQVGVSDRSSGKQI